MSEIGPQPIITTITLAIFMMILIYLILKNGGRF